MRWNRDERYLNLNGITRQSMANFASITLEVRGKRRDQEGRKGKGEGKEWRRGERVKNAGHGKLYISHARGEREIGDR